MTTTSGNDYKRKSRRDFAEKRIGYVQDNYAQVREEFYGNPTNSITEEETEVADHSFW